MKYDSEWIERILRIFDGFVSVLVRFHSVQWVVDDLFRWEVDCDFGLSEFWGRLWQSRMIQLYEK